MVSFKIDDANFQAMIIIVINSRALFFAVSIALG
jgi:hypothetical protein